MQASSIGGEDERSGLEQTRHPCKYPAISYIPYFLVGINHCLNLPALFIQSLLSICSTRFVLFGTGRTRTFGLRQATSFGLCWWTVPILLYLFFVPSATGLQGLEWCEYMKKIGVRVKECESSSTEVEVSSKEDINEPDSYETFSSFETCHGYYGRCKTSAECESGVLCTHKVTNQRCCTSPKNQCPSVDRMGYQCRKKNPVNWCNNNKDCGTNLVRSQICCPTGCGYNTCLHNVQNTPPSIKFKELHKSAKELNRDCPNPFLIPVNCMVPRPVSWCSSVRDCPTYNNFHPRRCCLTPCGYNICLTRLEDKWLIA